MAVLTFPRGSNTFSSLEHPLVEGQPLPKEILDFPLGLRLWPSELRKNGHQLQEGFTYSLLENSVDSFRFSILAGATKMAQIFRALPRLLPEETFAILEFYQEEGQEEGDKGEADREQEVAPTIYYSPYLPTRETLGILEPYLTRLIHDGFTGFGLANNRSGIEFFYSEEKVLTCFTGNHLRVMTFLAEFGIPFRPQLIFPADLGHDHLSLLCHPPGVLHQPLASMTETELDYQHFCEELVELLDLYPVEDDLSFFLSEKEQDEIEDCLRRHPEWEEFAEDDFGSLLLDWNDFVSECETGFEGDLTDYRQGLRLRDMIQSVVDGVREELQRKLLEIITDADRRFQKDLIDRRKRLDPPGASPAGGDRFWYRGVVRNQGVYLRRDLIRQGWYQP